MHRRTLKKNIQETACWEKSGFLREASEKDPLNQERARHRVERFQEKNRTMDEKEPKSTETLSRKEKRAILALVSGLGPTAAAKEAGIGKTTMFKYLRCPAFQAELRGWYDRQLTVLGASLNALAGEALAVLSKILADEDTDQSDRIRVAKLALEYTAGRAYKLGGGEAGIEFVGVAKIADWRKLAAKRRAAVEGEDER